MQARVRFGFGAGNPLRRSCVSRARNAGESAFWIWRGQPSAEIVRVEGAKWRRECILARSGATLCGERACRLCSNFSTRSNLWSWKLRTGSVTLLRVLKLYYKVASSHLPAPQILRVLKLYYKVASSHLPAPQILRVLKLHYKVASSQLPAPQIAPRTKVVLQSHQFSRLSHLSRLLWRPCS